MHYCYVYGGKRNLNFTYHILKHHKNYLSKHIWKENTFFTDGYFVCSIGNVSEKQLRKYIENQG